MQYTFESGPISVTIPSEPVAGNTGFSFSQQSFDYSDNMMVIGLGGTIFLNRFFLDISGQSAADGDDRATVSLSAFQTQDPSTAYLSSDPLYQASFDRTDIAVSLGYAVSRHFSVFAGYKKNKTEFDTTYEGPFTMVIHDTADAIPFDTLKGRLWGTAEFDFEYDGPFIGAVQGWEFTKDYYFSGVLTASLALAYLDSEVVADRRSVQMALTSIDGVDVPERTVGIVDQGFANRLDTTGETLGITIGLGWRGATAVEGLSYAIGVSGYRYEFDADDDAQSDINETALVYKVGLSYSF